MALTAAEISQRPTFVVGFPRSGTSLLRSIVSTHPLLQLAPETHFLSTWMPRFADADLADEDAFGRFWSAYSGDDQFGALELDAGELRTRVLAGERTWKGIFTTVMQAHAELYGKPGWGEKTPAHFEHLDTLFGWYPEARVLFVIRDPRAVVMSWQALDSAWTNRPLPWIVAGWKKSVAAALEWRADRRVHTFRYEDVVAGSLRGLFDHLDLDYPEAELSNRAGVGRPKGTYDPRGPIRSGGHDRWRDGMDRRSLATVEAAAAAEMEEFGYEPVITGWDRIVGRVRRRAVRATRQVRRTGRALGKRGGSR